MIESSYTKLFSSIVTSTIWCEDDKTRIVWITMLALKNRHGQVAGSVPGLANMAHVSVDDCRGALEKLKSPDADSRSTENEGRRIVAVDGGWQILNHAKYREAMSADERRTYQADWMKKHRAKKKAAKQPPVDSSVDRVESTLTHTDTDADTEAEAGTPLNSFAEWENTISRMYPSQWIGVKKEIQIKLTKARSVEAKSEWKRRLQVIDEKLLGPEVHDPVPVQPEAPAAAPCPEPEWKSGMEAIKAEVAAAEPAKPIKAVTKQLRFKRPPPLPPQNPHPV